MPPSLIRAYLLVLVLFEGPPLWGYLVREELKSRALRPVEFEGAETSKFDVPIGLGPVNLLWSTDTSSGTGDNTPGLFANDLCLKYAVDIHWGTSTTALV